MKLLSLDWSIFFFLDLFFDLFVCCFFCFCFFPHSLRSFHIFWLLASSSRCKIFCLNRSSLSKDQKGVLFVLLLGFLEFPVFQLWRLSSRQRMACQDVCFKTILTNSICYKINSLRALICNSRMLFYFFYSREIKSPELSGWIFS